MQISEESQLKRCEPTNEMEIDDDGEAKAGSIFEGTSQNSMLEACEEKKPIVVVMGNKGIDEVRQRRRRST